MINIVDMWELRTVYDNRKSFYGKALVLQCEDGSKLLRSYNTIVAKINVNGKYESYGKYSMTTSRHQKEFYKQYARYDGGDEQ